MASIAPTSPQALVALSAHGPGSLAEPAWVVAPAEGLLLAANDAGAELLGLPRGELAGPRPLDSAMPALATLRSLLAGDGLAAGRSVALPLLFWTSAGPRRLHCTCRAAATVDRPASVLVRTDGPAKAAPRPRPDAPTGGPDAAATLRKVAARISAELRARATGSGRTVASGAAAAFDSVAPGPIATASASDSQPDVRLHLAKLAHELRTPLGAIAAMSEIMRDERFGALANARYLDYASSIHDSTRHLLAVVESMLDHGSLAGGVPSLTFVDLDVAALAETAIAALQPLADKAGLTLDVQTAARLPLVIADQRTVHQMLLNLLTNAMKFTQRGGAIRVATRYADSGQVRLEVADSGPGMSSEEFARAGGQACGNLDEPADPVVGLRRGGGLGLGLPLVRSLAAANGARVEIDSAPGRGTRVVVVFPADRIVLR